MDNKKKFLVVRFAPGSGGKFLSTLLQCSNSVHAWDKELTEAKKENSHSKILSYIASKFTKNFKDWQKNEPEVPYQTDFVSNRFPRGDNITFDEAQDLLLLDAKYQSDYNNVGFVNLILNKSQVPAWLWDNSVLVNILIDTPESKKWFYRARFAKQFIKINNNYIVKQEHETFCSPKRSKLAEAFDNEKIFHGSWHAFAKKYIVGDKIGKMFTDARAVTSHPTNTRVENLFFNLSNFLDEHTFVEQIKALCIQLGIESPDLLLLSNAFKHYQSLHESQLNHKIFAGLSFNYTKIMNETKLKVQKACNHPNYIGNGIGDQVPSKELDRFLNTQQPTVLITDNKITAELKSNQYVLSIAPEYYGIHHMPFNLQKLPSPDRAYNCLINRICPNRQSWFYQLYDIGLDEGYVSFNVDYRTEPSNTYYDKIKVFDNLHYRYNTLFQSQYEATRSLIPFCNFEQTQDIENIICRSMISVVIETYFDDNRAIALSEKTFRALQLPRPFLLYAPKGTIQYLKDIGFELIDDIVDYSYDQNHSWITRQAAILDQVKHFLKNKNYTIPQRYLDIAYHNQQVMLNWKLTWDKKLLPSLTNATNILYNSNIDNGEQ
jgi:hypothetical protein